MNRLIIDDAVTSISMWGGWTLAWLMKADVAGDLDPWVLPLAIGPCVLAGIITAGKIHDLPSWATIIAFGGWMAATAVSYASL